MLVRHLALRTMKEPIAPEPPSNIGVFIVGGFLSLAYALTFSRLFEFVLPAEQLEAAPYTRIALFMLPIPVLLTAAYLRRSRRSEREAWWMGMLGYLVGALFLPGMAAWGFDGR